MTSFRNSDVCDVEMSSSTEDEEMNCSEQFEEGNSAGCWYEHPRYNRYWAHHRKLCNWFKQHRKVKRELAQKQFMQRYQQWYQQFNSGNPYYTQYMNWYNQMCVWYMQNARIYSQSHTRNIGNQQPFKVPSSPAPKSNAARDVETDRRRKRTESQDSKTSDSRPSSRGSNGRSSRRKRKKKDMERRRRRKEQIVVHMSDGEYILESEEAVIDDDLTEEFEMEITDEMLQFFAASAKHRHLRDTKKETDDITGEEKRVPKEETYVELGEVGAGKNRATVLPPSERPGVKRTSEMKLLYGKGAAMIHGMETAMQLTFDRNCDIKQPKPWPHLPLNIKFD